MGGRDIRRPPCDILRLVLSSEARFRQHRGPKLRSRNWAKGSAHNDTYQNQRKPQSRGKKDGNYKDILLNHLLKVNRKSRKLTKCVPTCPFRARKSNRSISNLQFNSILKFTGKQKIRKGSERGPQLKDKGDIETQMSDQRIQKVWQLGSPPVS